jgi:hypothetical protein
MQIFFLFDLVGSDIELADTGSPTMHRKFVIGY